MVAFFGFFEHEEIFVEFFLFRKGDGVDASELWTVFVAAPIGSGEVDEFDGFDGAEIDEVRTTAEVGEGSAFVEGDFAVIEFADAFEFVLVTFFGKEVDGFGFGDFATCDGCLGLNKFHHAFFDFREVFGGYFIFAEVDVVIETVFDGGAEAELDTGVELFECGSEKMGRGVPEGFFAFLVIPSEELNSSIVVDRTIKFDDLVVHFSGKDIACQAFADAFGDFEWSDTGFILADRAVGESNIYHNYILFQHQRIICNQL